MMPTDELPPLLRRILDEVRAFQRHLAPQTHTLMEWRGQVAAAQKLSCGVCVEDDGETVRLGELSPGCRACKEGKWDCVFVTMRCDLDCDFCLKPQGMVMRPMYSALGDELATLQARYAQAGILGVSFSGGEPFLDPQPVLERLAQLRRAVPHLYLWAYTHGLSLSVSLLDQLADAGLDELRFNMAASGYRHPVALQMLREAVRRIPAVAVEIPAIPEHAAILLEALPIWAEAGVRYLNLHELIYEVGSNSGAMQGARVACVLPDGHRCDANPHSLDLIRTVMIRAATDQLALGVNECSLRSKARQVRARRRMISQFVLQPHERLLEDGTAESACLFNTTHLEFVHPSMLEKQRLLREGWSAALLRRLPPLDIGHEGQWVDFEFVTK